MPERIAPHGLKPNFFRWCYSAGVLPDASTIPTDRSHPAHRLSDRQTWTSPCHGEIVVPAADGTTEFSVLQNEPKGT